MAWNWSWLADVAWDPRTCPFSAHNHLLVSEVSAILLPFGPISLIERSPQFLPVPKFHIPLTMETPNAETYVTELTGTTSGFIYP